MTTPDPPAPAPPQRFRTFMTSPGSWTLVLLLVFALLFVVAIGTDLPIIHRFTDVAFSRGVITFIITLATVAIAFVLVYSALYAGESSDDRFRRAREVFTALMGILGTIVGFYFGSTDTGTGALSLADLKVDGSEVRTFASGTSPFSYSVKVSDSTIATGSSEDGWIVYDLPSGTTARVVTIDVSDAAGRRMSRHVELPPPETPLPK